MKGYNFVIDLLPFAVRDKVPPVFSGAVYRHNFYVGESVSFDHVGVNTVFPFNSASDLAGMQSAVSVVRAGAVTSGIDGNNGWLDFPVYQSERQSFTVVGKNLRSIVYVKPIEFNLTPDIGVEWVPYVVAQYSFIPLGIARTDVRLGIDLPVAVDFTSYLGNFTPFAFLGDLTAQAFIPEVDMSIMSRVCNYWDGGAIRTVVFNNTEVLSHINPVNRLRRGQYDFAPQISIGDFLSSKWHLVVASYPE